ncbi:MAG: HAD-IA family hydrolase [Candidatus Saccharibacteria bacterium]
MNNGGSNLERVLGTRIQALRRAAGLTQQQLCNQANISYSTLTKIERGAIKSPSIFTVESIAVAIGVSLDQMVGNDSSNSSRELRKSSSGVSFVYFDVNGCLVRFYQRAFTIIADEFEVPADVVETAYLHYNDQVCRGTLSLDDFNKKMAEKIGTKSIDWKSYYLQSVDSVPGTGELIRQLHKYYRVGLLTNIMPGFLSALRRSTKVPDIEYDAIIDSSEVGLIKPEAKMYQLAQQKAGVDPSEILLVDDTRSNVIAAEKAGWHVLWFDYANPEESVKQIQQTLKVT